MIGEIKKVIITCPKERRTEMTSLLQNLGIMEIGDFQKDPYFSRALSENKVSALEIEERIKELTYLKDRLSKSKQKVAISSSQLSSLIGKHNFTSLYRKVKKLERKIERKERRTERVEEIAKSLQSLKNLNISTKELFQIKTGFSLCRQEEKEYNSLSLKLRKEAVYLINLQKVNKEIFFLLFYPMDREKKVFEILEKSRAKKEKIPYFRRLPSKELKVCQELIEKSKREKKVILSEIEKLSKECPKILALLDYYLNILEKIKVQRYYGLTKNNFLFWGWVSKKDLPLLKEKLSERFKESFILEKEPGKKDEVPLILENRKPIQPFEAVTDLYGRPVYKGIDPSPFLSVFFPLSFAFCLTDACYGLILTLIMAIFLFHIRRRKIEKRLLYVFLYSGLATIIFGALFGGWFGDLFDRFPLLLRFKNSILIFDPIKDPSTTIKFFFLALMVGYIQITFGMAIKLKESFRRLGKRGLFTNLPPLFFQLAVPSSLFIYLFKDKISFSRSLLQALIPLIGLSVILVIIHQWQKNKEISLKIFWSLYSIYSLLVGNLISDLLSYSRLFALGLTTGLLALTVNELTFLVLPVRYIGIIGAVLIFIFGHLFTIAVNLLSAYVHTSRLQYLEFFTKFYESGGRAFHPFALQQKYTIKI